MAGVDLKVMPRRAPHLRDRRFPEIAGPIPVTDDRKTGFYFRKEMDKIR